MEMDNSTAQLDNNTAQHEQEGEAPVYNQSAPATKTEFSWKSNLSPDLKGAPLFMKFDDSVDGLNKALESHANLEKLLGQEKIPVPKDANDKEGWARYRTAMKVPEKPEGYQLPDAKLPDSLKGVMIDKNKFASLIHAQNATPQQANELWKAYIQENITNYNNHLNQLQQNLDQTINVLKQEWGAAYDVNVQLGQSVIDQFGETQESKDYLTATLLKDPHGIKFLQKLGNQFAENKIGDFNVKRFAVSPEDAQAELDELTGNINGPYFNQGNKFSLREQEAAIKKADSLRAVIARAKQRQAQ